MCLAGLTGCGGSSPAPDTAQLVSRAVSLKIDTVGVTINSTITKAAGTALATVTGTASLRLHPSLEAALTFTTAGRTINERIVGQIAGEVAERLLPRTEAAFVGPHFWEIFDRDARQLQSERLNAWLDRWSPIIASQFPRRRSPASISGDQPRSTGGLETFIKPIEAALYRRRYGLGLRRIRGAMSVVRIGAPPLRDRS